MKNQKMRYESGDVMMIVFGYRIKKSNQVRILEIVRKKKLDTELGRIVPHGGSYSLLIESVA